MIEDCGVSVTVVMEAAALNDLMLAGVELMENEELDDKGVVVVNVIEVTNFVKVPGDVVDVYAILVATSVKVPRNVFEIEKSVDTSRAINLSGDRLSGGNSRNV